MVGAEGCEVAHLVVVAALYVVDVGGWRGAACAVGLYVGAPVSVAVEHPGPEGGPVDG
jgi:hypothetical protein